MEEITFSKHALRKIEERKLSEDMVKKVLNEPEFIFYNLLTNAIVAIANVKIGAISTYLVIPYTKEDEKIKVITVYPCRDINREIKKKEGKRWVKIR